MCAKQSLVIVFRQHNIIYTTYNIQHTNTHSEIVRMPVGADKAKSSHTTCSLVGTETHGHGERRRRRTMEEDPDVRTRARSRHAIYIIRTIHVWVCVHYAYIARHLSLRRSKPPGGAQSFVGTTTRPRQRRRRRWLRGVNMRLVRATACMLKIKYYVYVQHNHRLRCSARRLWFIHMYILYMCSSIYFSSILCGEMNNLIIYLVLRRISRIGIYVRTNVYVEHITYAATTVDYNKWACPVCGSAYDCYRTIVMDPRMVSAIQKSDKERERETEKLRHNLGLDQMVIGSLWRAESVIKNMLTITHLLKSSQGWSNSYIPMQEVHSYSPKTA